VFFVCLFVCFQRGSYLPGAGHDLRSLSSHLCFLNSWDHKCEPPYLANLLRWGVTNFLSRLALNLDPTDLCLVSSWDYRHVSPHLALFSFFYSTFTFLLRFICRSFHLGFGILCVSDESHSFLPTSYENYILFFLLALCCFLNF
jgi:hypothetical protein